MQLYLSFPKEPNSSILALRWFKRVHLTPGETQRVHLMLDARDLSLVNASGDRVVAAGSYRVFIGGGQPGMVPQGVQGQFAIRGKLSLPD